MKMGEETERRPLNNKERWYKLLGIYKRMTSEGSVVFMEAKGKNNFLSAPLPEKVVVSFFVNEEGYFALSNLGLEACTLRLKMPWEDALTGERVESVPLSPGAFAILRWSGQKR